MDSTATRALVLCILFLLSTIEPLEDFQNLHSSHASALVFNFKQYTHSRKF